MDMNKKIGLAFFSAIAITLIGGIVFGLATYTKKKRITSGYHYYYYPIHTPDISRLVPIEEITGINSKATLKPGSTITEGSDAAYINYGEWYHGRNIKFAPEVLESLGYSDKDSGDTEYQGLHVSNIRIVDVYGDKCTIMFTCTDDNYEYACDDYPLENLDYNVKKVEAADDGVKANLVMMRRFLTYPIIFQRTGIALMICGAAIGVTAVFLRAKNNKQRGDSFDK